MLIQRAAVLTALVSAVGAFTGPQAVLSGKHMADGALSQGVHNAAIPITSSEHRSRPSLTALCMSSSDTQTAENSSTSPDVDAQTDSLQIPFTFDEMTRQAVSAMQDGYAKGMKRQIVRVLLPRDPSSAKLGQFYEADGDVEDRSLTQDLLLYPLDESWQGGIMQLYRAASPTCRAMLRKFSSNEGGLPPKLVEDRSIDASGVDGIGLWMSQNTNPKEDISCFVQPSQETIGAIETISEQAGSRLVALLNPQWRVVDDALDSASRDSGLMGNLASFLGGKGDSLKRLEGLGYQSVYTLEGYVCKGGNIRLIKRFDSDWAVFAENDAGTSYIKVGTSKARPTYQDVDKMLDEKGVTLKYARDFGLAPKFEE